MSRHLPRDFLQTTGLLNRGRFVERVNEAVGRVLQALEDMPDATGKGSVALTFKFNSRGGEITLAADVKTTLPNLPPLAPTTFWLVDGELSAQHPEQTELDLGPRDIRTA